MRFEHATTSTMMTATVSSASTTYAHFPSTTSSRSNALFWAASVLTASQTGPVSPLIVINDLLQTDNIKKTEVDYYWDCRRHSDHFVLSLQLRIYILLSVVLTLIQIGHARFMEYCWLRGILPSDNHANVACWARKRPLMFVRSIRNLKFVSDSLAENHLS